MFFLKSHQIGKFFIKYKNCVYYPSYLWKFWVRSILNGLPKNMFASNKDIKLYVVSLASNKNIGYVMKYFNQKVICEK